MKAKKRVLILGGLTLLMLLCVTRLKPIDQPTTANAFVASPVDKTINFNHIEHLEIVHPDAETCLDCHGEKVAYAVGITIQPDNSGPHSLSNPTILVTLHNGTLVSIPAREYTLSQDHTIFSSTSQLDAKTGQRINSVFAIVIPAGTNIDIHSDGVDLSTEAYNQPYHVKTHIIFPYEQSATLPNGTIISFDDIVNYSEATADIQSSDPNPDISNVARTWIEASITALAWDELGYETDAPVNETITDQGPITDQCAECHSEYLEW